MCSDPPFFRPDYEDISDEDDPNLSEPLSVSWTPWGCSAMLPTYERMEKLGEGTFGVVWKAKVKVGLPPLNPKVKAETPDIKPDQSVAPGKRTSAELVRVVDGTGSVVRPRARVGDIVALKQIIFHNQRDGVRAIPLPFFAVRD